MTFHRLLRECDPSFQEQVCAGFLFSCVVIGCSLLYCGSSSCSVKTAHRLLRTCDPSFQEQVCASFCCSVV
jgi:hypothetical protein